MARHRFTKEETIRGVEKAIANPKTPKHLLPSLQKRLATLKGESR
jgi:hypothetical protein